MSVERIGTRIWLAGLILVAAAIAWWFVFFSSELARASAAVIGLTPRLIDVVGCLSVSEGPCAVISGLARVGGRVAYEPMVLWAGIAALWTGASMRILAEWRARPARAGHRIGPVLG